MASAAHAPAWVSLGDVLRRGRADFSAAEECYDRALLADPRSADALGNLANIAADVHDDDAKAERLYRLALAEDPGHADNLVNFADLLADVVTELPPAQASGSRLHA